MTAPRRPAAGTSPRAVQLNAEAVAFAGHYGFDIDVLAANRPTGKGRVERYDDITRAHVPAGRTFRSIGQGDSAFLTLLPIRPAQVHRTYGQVIGERAVIDRTALRPLPAMAYVVAEVHVRRVGKDYLLSTALKAIEELRAAKAPGRAFPGQLLADIVPAEVITTLAVIEQTDDSDFVRKKEDAFNEVLSHYGLKKEEAYRYSVSSAAALGAMQFTDRRGNGTYSLVVRRCPEAKIDPNFERGATNLLNAMKAAVCLFDIELAQMRADIREAYRDNMKVLGIFPVAAYNGGPRNVGKLYNVMKRMKVKLEELRPPGEEPEGKKVVCPCLWKDGSNGAFPVAIPRYNNENRWYIEKYQSILSVFDADGEAALR